MALDVHVAVRRFRPHSQCSEVRNLETDNLARAKGSKPFWGNCSFLWYDLNCHHQKAKENPLSRFSWETVKVRSLTI